MIRKLIPLLLALVGLGAGLAAGFAFKPSSHDAATPATAPAPSSAAHASSRGKAASSEYVKLPNQFVVPLIKEGKVRSMVIVSLSIEVRPGKTAEAYAQVPKLRDAFLQVMFDHANAGGFDGSFTDSGQMRPLRRALLEAAQQVVGPDVIDVLITDIVRQDT